MKLVNSRNKRHLTALLTGMLACTSVQAENPQRLACLDASECAKTVLPMLDADPNPTYALGIRRFQLDSESQVTGWQLGQRWYFGSKRGGAPNLGFVRQGKSTRVTMGTRGVELHVRF